MLSTCTSLLEAMQVRLSQLEAANFDKRMQFLETSLCSRSGGRNLHKEETAEDNSIWAEALRSTLKRSPGTPGESGKRTPGTPLRSVDSTKSPSSASQGSNQFGSLSQASQALQPFPRDREVLSSEQSQSVQERTLAPQMSLLSRAKQIDLHVLEEDPAGGSISLPARGRGSFGAAPAGAAGHNQPPSRVLRETSPPLPPSTGKPPAFHPRNRSADAIRSTRPEDVSMSKSTAMHRNPGPCSPTPTHANRLVHPHDRSSAMTLNNSNRGQQTLRAQSSQGMPHTYVQHSLGRTSTSVMGQPLRVGP